MPDLRRGTDVTVVGVLSDSHLPYRLRRLPDEVLRIFGDVDLILHAGDVDRIEFLGDLAALAPLHAVRGNLHWRDLSDGGRDLPADLRLTVAGREVVVNHGGWTGLFSQAGDWFVESLIMPGGDRLNERMANRLVALYPQADVVVFGHSHRAYYAWHNRTFVFNPGAVCPTKRQIPSVGRLYLGPDSIEAEVVPLA